MDRRSFLKDAALAGALAITPTALSSCVKEKPSKNDSVSADFSFREDGSFTVLQFTDTHYIAGDERSQRALDCVSEAIEGVKPDLIIHTGDIVFGSPDLQSATEILQPISDSGIPFAVALGNHDSEYGSTREEMMSHICSMKGCVNTGVKEGIYGASNDVITLSQDGVVKRALYVIDSNDYVLLRGEEHNTYDYIRHSQIDWYRNHSARLAAANGGKPLPSLAFFHIPLREIEEGLASEDYDLAGNNGEPPCPSRINSGLYAQLIEMGDVEAVVNGHDHNCDYVLRHGPMFYIYGRYSGCNTVYNDLGRDGISGESIPGCRVFSFKKDEPGFTTWVRLYGGEIQQKVYLNAGAMTRLG